MSGYEFDPEKNELNRRRHGLGLDELLCFDLEPEPVTIVDSRREYGETRLRTFGRVDGKAYMIAFTVRDGRARLISFRRCHEKEMRRYGRT